MRRDAEKKFQRAVQIRPAPFRLKEQYFANDSQHMPASFARWNEFLDLVAEKNQSNLVVISNRRERQDRCNLCRKFALRLLTRTEQTRPTDIHDQHQSQFAFFDEFL